MKNKIAGCALALLAFSLLWGMGQTKDEQLEQMKEFPESGSFAPEPASAPAPALPTPLSPVEPANFKAALLWQIGNMDTLEFAPIDYVLSLAFSPDGKTLASGSCAVKRKATSAYDAQGKLIANLDLCDKGEIKLWEMETGKLLKAFAGGASSFTSLAFSPDGKSLAGSNYKSIMILNPKNASLTRTIKDKGSIGEVAFSPDGKNLAANYAVWPEDLKTVKIWNLNTGGVLKVMDSSKCESLGGRFMAYSPDGKIIAGEGAEPWFIKTWLVSTGSAFREWQVCGTVINDAQFSPDGRRIASVCFDGKIRFWDLESGKMIDEIYAHGDAIMAIAFSPDGKIIVSGGKDHSVKIWNLQDMSLLQELKLEGEVNTLAFSPDGRYLAVAGCWVEDPVDAQNLNLGYNCNVGGIWVFKIAE